MDGLSIIRPFVLYRLKGARHPCVDIRILYVLLVNSFSTLPRLHIIVDNAAREGDAIDNTGRIDLINGWERTRGKSATALSDRWIAGLISSGA